MNLLIANAKQVVTCHTNGNKFKSGKFQSQMGVLENTSIYAENGIIKWLGKKLSPEIKKSSLKKINAKNKIVLPGFIDSHTHLVFAGSRSDEFSMRVKGKSYEEIAKAGGGIVNTVNAVRKASKNELKELAKKRIKTFISFGVTTLEAKSGYGLDKKNEIKTLEVINELNDEVPIELLATYLGAHAFHEERPRDEYLEEILYEMIPLISKRGLAKFIDVFCELSYFTPEETDRILRQGRQFGLIPKLHTNQFYSIGGIETALNNNAISVDHLETMKHGDIQALAGKNIIACLLPAVSYFLDMPYSPAREMIKCNIPIALATDFNPGTSMTENIQLVMSLAVQKLKMNIEETINSVTINAAAALGISDRTGSIEPGKQADLLIFDMPDYSHLIYHFGVNHIEKVIKKGKVIYDT